MVMQATSEPTPLFVEKRFPLDLNPTIPAIEELYQTAKARRWNPERDIPWDQLGAERYDDATRQAARLTWSRRAWIEYTALQETPALLVRFCLEEGRERDPKFFLTVRNTEEAWHIDSFDRLAERFGGRVQRPSQPAYEGLFNQNRQRRALHAGHSLMAYVVAYCAFEDGLELELFKLFRRNATNPAVAGVLDHYIAGKERHVSFGWLYAQEHAARWDDAERAAIAAEVEAYMRDVELRGYHCPWLSNAAKAEADADAVCARAGLGGASAEDEAAVLKAHVGEARLRLRELGVAIPEFHHPLIGTL